MKRLPHVQKRVILALILLFVLLLVIGPTGYMVIEDMTFTQAFFMTVSTIFTVGFNVVNRPLSAAGIYFTIFLIIFGVFALFFLISAVIDFIFREAFRETFGRRRMDRQIKDLKQHHIVCGYGRVGEVVCDTLSQAGADFVMIEIDPQLVEEADKKGYLYVKGDATETETLKEAGIERAKGLICALESDADNTYATLTARTLNSELTIVARSASPDSVDKLRFAGADRVVSPYTISGRRMASYLLKPGVFEYMDLVAAHDAEIEFRLEELVVEKGSAMDGSSIAGCRIREETGALVLALRKTGSDEFIANPDKETVINGGDMIIAVGSRENIIALEKLALKRGRTKGYH